MAVWGYYDTTSTDAWQIWLEDHTTQIANVCFQSDAHNIVWETYFPQPDWMKAGNDGENLGINYKVCLRPFQITTDYGWWDIAKKYKDRLDATNPFFRVPVWAERTDIHQFEAGPWITLYWVHNLTGQSGNDQLLDVIDELRTQLGVGLEIPVYGWGAMPQQPHDRLDYPYTEVVAGDDRRAMIIAARAKNAFLGKHRSGTPLPHIYDIHKVKDTWDWWGDYEPEAIVRASRKTYFDGETSDNLDIGDNADGSTGGPKYRVKEYIVQSYNPTTKILTLQGSPLTASEWNDLDRVRATFDSGLSSGGFGGGGGSVTKLAKAEVVGNSAGDVTDPTSEIKLSTNFLDYNGSQFNPVHNDVVYVHTEFFTECPYSLVNSNIKDFLIQATWGGMFDVYQATTFYLDVYSLRNHRGVEEFSCSGEHAGWAQHDTSYVPHPQGGGTWLVQAELDWLEALGDYVRERHNALKGTPIAFVACEHLSEQYIPHARDDLHVVRSGDLWRSLKDGGVDYDASPRPDTNPGYVGVPMFSVVHGGRAVSRTTGDHFSNGLLDPDIARSSADTGAAKFVKISGYWLAYEWAQGANTPVFANYATDTFTGGDNSPWDASQYSADHPLGAANSEISTLAQLWVELNTAEITWAGRFLRNGNMLAPLSHHVDTTMVDMETYGLYDRVQLPGGNFADLRSGFPVIWSRGSHPAVTHAVWQAYDNPNWVCVFLTNWTNASATWKSAIDLQKLGYAPNQVISVFQTTYDGHPTFIGNYENTATIELNVAKYHLTSLVFVPSSAVDETAFVTPEVGNLQVRTTGIEGELKITWSNPSLEANDTDKYSYPGIKEVILVRKQSGYPTTIDDGTIVYRGLLEEYLDTGLKPLTAYHYAAFIDDGSEDTTE
jgi:hypothetical protein